MPNSALTQLFQPSAVLRSPLGTSIWLLHLRWFAVFGQLVTITAVSYFYPVFLPVSPLFGLVGFTAATNLAYAIWLGTHQQPEEHIDTDDALHRTRVASLLLSLDLITLAGMLYFSGGIDNPFVFFFFVNLAVAGVILTPPWAWSLTVLAIVSFAILIDHRTPIPLLTFDADAQGSRIRQQGMLVAFSACAAVVTYFVSRIANELTLRQSQLREAQQARSRSQRLEALTTLAAGAAHELASPLSTIAVIVRELERHAESIEMPATMENDLRLIDSEVNHCKAILSRMRGAAGDQVAEHWEQISIVDLVDAIVDGIREPHRVDVSDDVDAHEDYSIWIPLEATAQAVRNLVGNALDASPDLESVAIDVTVREDEFEIRVTDRGEGMQEDVLSRAVEPFFTTKEPGSGMGLGLFLARNVITRLGGKLDFVSTIGEGTVAIVTLPKRPSSIRTV